MWGNEPSHSQVDSHVGSWNFKWTLESLECDCKGQNLLPWKKNYIIGNLLKLKCLKWAHIAHLDICNISYGQKKGWESNWQFDSWPLKVRNWPHFLACRWHAAYHWKVLNKDYNFSLDYIAIRGLHAKLCPSKVVGVLVVGISGLPFGNPGTKNHLDVVPVERHRVYYKGKGGGFPKSGPRWVLCVWVTRGSPRTKSVSTVH